MKIRTILSCGLAAALATMASAAPTPTALIAGGGSTLISWGYPTPETIPNLVSLAAQGSYQGLATNVAGELLASYSYTFENSIRRFGTSGQTLPSLVTATSSPRFRSVAVAPNEDILLVVSLGGTNPYEVRRYDAAGAYLNTPYTGLANNTIDDVLVTPDGKAFVIQRSNTSPAFASIQIFDPATGAVLGSIAMPPGTSPGSTRTPNNIELGLDGNLYFITGPDTSIYRVAPTPGAIPFPIAQITDNINTFTIGPDGLIYGAAGGTVTRYALDGTNVGVFATLQGSSITLLHFGNVLAPTNDDCLPR